MKLLIFFIKIIFIFYLEKLYTLNIVVIQCFGYEKNIAQKQMFVVLIKNSSRLS